MQNIYEQNNNNIIIGNNVGQNANRNNMEENNEVDNRGRVNVKHLHLDKEIMLGGQVRMRI